MGISTHVCQEERHHTSLLRRISEIELNDGLELMTDTEHVHMNRLSLLRKETFGVGREYQTLACHHISGRSLKSFLRIKSVFLLYAHAFEFLNSKALQER